VKKEDQEALYRKITELIHSGELKFTREENGTCAYRAWVSDVCFKFTILPGQPPTLDISKWRTGAASVYAETGFHLLAFIALIDAQGQRDARGDPAAALALCQKVTLFDKAFPCS